MTDIIQDAKQLLDGATPGPWKWEERSCKGDFRCSHDWLGSEHGTALETTDSDEYSSWVESSDLDKALIAAAPELAQALAEEAYFYGVQVWMGGRWIMMLNSNHGTSLMHRGKWFERKDEADECAAKWNHDTPTRIVRQRRSPMEEIE